MVALTANAGSDNQLLYRKEGFSGYLAKPVSGALLEAAVLSILPKELVRLNEEVRQSDIDKDILIFEQVKRRSILVTTDSVCDLPEALKKEFGISVCPYYVCTDEGRFLDEEELRPDELLIHIAEGRKGYSQPPEVEDYERFFAEKLTEAQNVIHITMAKHVSEGYNNALEAAKSFENVTVIDSGHLSSSMGPGGTVRGLSGGTPRRKNRNCGGGETDGAVCFLRLYHQQHSYAVSGRTNLEEDPDSLRCAAAAPGPYAAEEPHGGWQHGDGQLYPCGKEICEKGAPGYQKYRPAHSVYHILRNG